jgi:hypothetical protein
MNSGRILHLSPWMLLKEATDWLVTAVVRTRPQNQRKQERGTETHSVNIDRLQVDQIAKEHFKRRVDAVVAVERSSAELVETICHEWGRPEATRLAQAWLRGDDTELKGVHMEMEWVVRLIGAAAGAAVLALVLLARRNATITACGRELPVSKDFSAMQRVRDQGGPASEIARSIIDSELSPWNFVLESAVRQLTASDKRTLLSALEPLGVEVEVISPSPGERFDPEQMSSGRVVGDGSHWVVAASPKAEDIGFRLRGRMEVRAEVDACTADWWCLALADVACPIAAIVKEDPDKYVGFEADYAPFWSVVQGFSAFADLRTEFDEEILFDWSARLRERLSKWYSPSSGRLPVTFGTAGERYDPSVMKSVDTVPEADARVVAVEERAGRPQVGLGCIGAPPLLYALVRVEEV